MSASFVNYESKDCDCVTESDSQVTEVTVWLKEAKRSYKLQKTVSWSGEVFEVVYVKCLKWFM